MELKTNKQKKAGAWTLVCVLVLAVLLLLLIRRVPYGYDWTDEEYYSAITYRLLQGDRLLVDMWEVHQFSAVIAAPVLWAYLALNSGNTDGCILFMRYFYVCFQFLTSVYAFFVFRKRSGNLGALFAAAMLLGYTHYAINSYYYDSMALMFGVLSVLLVFEFLERSRGSYWRAAFGGAAYTASVMAFPHFILSLPIYICFWWIRIKKGKPDRRNGYGALWFLGGSAAVALSVAALVFARSSFSEVSGGISGMLSDPDHQAIGVVRVIGSYLNALRVLYGPVSYGAAGLLALGIGASYAKKPSTKRYLRLIGMIAAVLLMLGATLRAFTYDWPGYLKINLLAAGLALFAPGLYFLSGRKADRIIFLYCLSCALSIAVQIGSNTRIQAASGMLLPASVATVLYLFDQKEALFHFDFGKKSAKRRNGGLGFSLQSAAAVACILFIVALFTLRLTTAYRDETISNLDVAIEAGAARGIYTTQESASKHDRLVEDIRDAAFGDGAILITGLFPEGYLLTGLSAATPSAYWMQMDSEWLEIYYEKNPQRRPTVVFALDSDMDYNDCSMEGSELYENDPNYKKTTLASGTIYTLIGD